MKYFKLSNSPLIQSDGKISRNFLSLLFSLGFSLLVVVSVTQFSTYENKPVNNEFSVKKLAYKKDPPVIAQTRQGPVQGSQKESRNGIIYSSFYNIPYAKKPINELRFRPPEPLDDVYSNDVRDGSKQGPQCIQRQKYAEPPTALGSEDCLAVNIFTPNLPPPSKISQNSNGSPTVNLTESESYPVLFYVHGGEFTSGNASRYGADYFEDEPVVVVTVQFRLGPFGFLNTEDEESPGNLAFKDVIMALRWIKDNISFFSGDPTKVTVFGNSSGSIMVHALLLSQMSIGLFSGAICQSGTSIVQGSILPNPKNMAVNLGIEMGCPQPSTTKELVDCLRKVPAEDLALVQNPYIFFAPTIDYIPADGNLSNVFLSDYPYKLMQQENYPVKVPFIIGDNSQEELGTTLDILRDPELVDNWNEDFSTTLTKQVLFRHPPSAETLERIQKYYFGSRQVGNETRERLGNLLADILWNHGTKLAALAHAKHSPTYLYWLTKEPAKSYANLEGFSPPFGVSHADELQYFFLYDGYPEIPIGSPYTKFSQKLVKNWVHFAKFGKPELTEWETIQVADNGTKWFKLDDEVKTTRRLRLRMNFWDDYKYELYE